MHRCKSMIDSFSGFLKIVSRADFDFCGHQFDRLYNISEYYVRAMYIIIMQHNVSIHVIETKHPL